MGCQRPDTVLRLALSAEVEAVYIDYHRGLIKTQHRLRAKYPDKTYTLTEQDVRVGEKPCPLSGKKFSGRYLMDVGIEVTLWEDYASRVFEIN